MHLLENENDAASMNKILERLRYIRDLRKTSVMVVHHLRKENQRDRGMSGQRMRGSSVLHAKSESGLYLEKWGDLVRISIETKTQQGRVLELRYTKQGFVFEDEHGAGVGDGDGSQ
jgi:RecA-family ATPase